MNLALITLTTKEHIDAAQIKNTQFYHKIIVHQALYYIKCPNSLLFYPRRPELLQNPINGIVDNVLRQAISSVNKALPQVSHA